MKYLQSFFSSPNPFLTTVLFVTGGLTAYLILFHLAKRYKKLYDPALVDQTLRRLKYPSLWLIVTLSLFLPLKIYFPDSYLLLTIRHILIILMICLLAWISIRLVKLSRFFLLKKYDIEQKDNLKSRKVLTQFRIIENILIALIVIIAFSMILMSFDNIKRIGISLFASAGVAGLVLGLAAQKLIGTILAGIQIAISQPIRVDDVVIVENEWGWIEELTLTYVVVRIWDKRRLVVPTTYFIEKPFQNWTRVSADILGTVFIYTDYTVPFDELRSELTRLLKSSEHWDGEVNVLQVTNATDKTVEVRALMSAKDSPSAWNLRVYVREHLISFLQKRYPESLPKSRVVLEQAENK